MNKSELLTKIKKLEQIEPSQLWTASNKAFIFEYIKTKEAEEKKPFILSAGNGFAFAREILGNLFLRLKNNRFVVCATVAIAVLVFGGNFILAKAAGSLPGDTLYPLKLAAEKTQLSFTLNRDKRVALTFELTEKRLNEYYLLTTAESGDANSSQGAKIAAENLKTQLDAASAELESAKSKLETQKTVAIAKIADSKTSAYAQKLKNSADAKTAAKAGNKEAAEIIDKINEVNNNALTVLATNASESDSKEVAAKVGEKIKSSEEKIGLIEQKILAVMIEQEKNKTDSKENLTPKLIIEAKGILQEAKTALLNNDRSKALELVISSEQISKVAEKMADAAEEKKENIGTGSTEATTTKTPKDTQPKMETNNTVNTLNTVPAEKQ